MKHLILLVLGVFLLTGCMAVGPKYEHGEKFDTIKYGSYDISLLRYTNKIPFDKQTNYISNYQMYEQIKRVSEETLAKDKKFFALIDNGTNNLNGFPITDFKSLQNYCFPYNDEKTYFLDQGAYSKCSIAGSKGLNFVMFKEKIPGIYLWDAEATLKDLK